MQLDFNIISINYLFTHQPPLLSATEGVNVKKIMLISAYNYI